MEYNRREFLKFAGASAACLGLAGVLRGAVKSDLPNIVFVIVDDMGYSDLGCMGGDAETPETDRQPPEAHPPGLGDQLGKAAVEQVGGEQGDDEPVAPVFVVQPGVDQRAELPVVQEDKQDRQRRNLDPRRGGQGGAKRYPIRLDDHVGQRT